MSATAAEQLRRILHLIPRLADGETHSLAEVARLARVDRAVVLQDIESISEEQREVFLMREFLDLPFKQIADVVGVPENTVKSRMRYALEKLRLELDEYADLAKAVP